MLDSPQTTTILVGHVNINSPDAVMVRVTEIVIHPENNYIYNNDIALLRLEEPVTLNDKQRPICLSDAPKERSPSLPCYVSGWGVVNVTGIATIELSTILHHTKLKIWEQSKCERSYPGQIKPTMLCAGYYSGEMDACKGDSGGPLMCQTQPDQWELVGIVSWGEGCGQIGKPGVYTRVDYYLQWIQSVTSYANKEGVTCDFEHPDLCGYTSKSQSEFAWSRRSGGVHYPIMPDMDNTLKNASGHYVYTYFPYGASQKSAVLSSPPLPAKEDTSCLYASTIIYQCELCKLEVKVVDSLGNLSGALLKVSSKFSTSWLRFNVDIPMSTQHIQFISTSGQWSGGGIGLDDVTLEPGVCENTMKVNCNFDNRTKSTPQFNDEICSYTQESFTDDFDWLMVQDKENGDGFLRAQNAFGYQGYRARILSPRLKSYISMCVSFEFRASSRSAGFLQVCRLLSVNGNDSLDCSFWSSRLNAFTDPTSWTSVHVTLPSSDFEFSIVFEMVQGQGQGYIDIDDIFKLDGDCL
ncbi:unnamed protein product [Lymnaea stagnalis]|uniref:Uncharacterized protein n=1 Tax=Lymnaea stagnalis TaxID=6523 RepID=A0AAV2I7Z8_LYMST